MNLERSPVVDGIVLRRYRGDDAHLRMLAEQITTDTWPSVRLVKGGDDHGIWEGTRRMRIYPQGLLEGGEETELPEASLAFGRRF